MQAVESFIAEARQGTNNVFLPREQKYEGQLCETNEACSVADVFPLPLIGGVQLVEAED